MLLDPSDLLKNYLNQQVCTGIRTGELIEGKLLGFDEHHNILLKTAEAARFVRGEMIIFIAQSNQ